MITCNSQDFDESPVSESMFDRNTSGFCDGRYISVEKRLERLIFQVSMKPHSLIAHVERVYFCFLNYLNEQLFAALIDLQIILQKRGLALSKRMIHGSKSRLTESQFQTLNLHLSSDHASVATLPCSRYSLFTKGLHSVAELVQVTEERNKSDLDPLRIARDFVEFSQLKDAISVLEQALLVQPERVELHHELLSLYRSTREQTCFSRTYRHLSQKNVILPKEWMELQEFFKGLNHAGK